MPNVDANVISRDHASPRDRPGDVAFEAERYFISRQDVEMRQILIENGWTLESRFGLRVIVLGHALF